MTQGNAATNSAAIGTEGAPTTKAALRDPQTSPYRRILEWSQKRPKWQRDALQRIVSQSTITPVDLGDLWNLLRAEAGLGDDPEAELRRAQPLAQAHIPQAAPETATVTLRHIEAVANLDRLAPDQQINFAEDGLTIVYGDNGTGKSGYARLLKTVCRARSGVPELQGDIRKKPTPAPSAMIAYRTGDTEHTCTVGTDAPPALGQVSVFDAACARQHTHQDGSAAYVPFGLDVLPALAGICTELQQRAKQEQQTIDRGRSEKITALIAPMRGAQFASSFVEQISGSETEDQLRTKLTLSDQEQARVADLRRLLAKDPRTKIDALTGKLNRLRRLAGQFEHAISLADDEALANARELCHVYTSAQKAASITDALGADMVRLPGTGEGAWRSLFEAARRFVVEHQPNTQFPDTASDGLCPLCQQTLDSDARKRLLAFDSFLKADALRQVTRAEASLQEALQSLDGRANLEHEIARLVEDEQEPLSESLVAALQSTAASNNGRVTQMQMILRGDEDASPISNDTAGLSQLAAFIDVEQARLEALAAVAQAENQEALQSELREYEAKTHLLESIDALLELVRLSRQASMLKECIRLTSTNAISRYAGDLSRTFLTDAYVQAFASELRAFNLRSIDVAMVEARQRKGQPEFGLRLRAQPSVRVTKIASEGEERCVAIAGFLAEVRQNASASAIVLDDPVSSLDHHMRERIAARLVAEAKARQVVIFTHDAIFVASLLAAARQANVAVLPQRLEWHNGHAGVCKTGLPRDQAKCKERRNNLEQEARSLVRAWASPRPTQENIRAWEGLYSDLRALVERIIEEVVFNGTISRLQWSIRVRQLWKVVALEPTERDDLARIYKRACDATNAHDTPAGVQLNPDPQQIVTDLERLKRIMDAVRARQKEHDQQRKDEQASVA